MIEVERKNSSRTVQTPAKLQVAQAVWTLATPAPRRKLLELSEKFGVSPLLASVLASRGLNPDLLSSALTLTPNPALKVAAGRIIAAMDAGKRIRIHGDYDADGITASSVLMLGLRALGANVHAFIPHRLNEGYGIHPDKVLEHTQSCDLLVTVDCGVTNLDEVEAITKAGVEVIVTDHHSPGREIPHCLVVHPALTPNYDHDLHNLTGAGVAYHLLWAVHEALGKPPPLEYADIACIGIIADVAPLIGENRALVLAGLEQMRSSKHAGLRAVLSQKNLERPTARDVAFIIAPRINAAGRLGEAEIALEFLTTHSERRALELTVYMDARNVERQAIQAKMFEQALEMVNPKDPALVVTHDDWHAGIMGIVASKLLEKFYKPVFIIAQGKGSVRSTPGISAVEGLRYSADLLKRYGGHSGAAGFALYSENIPALTQRLHAFAEQFPLPVPRVKLDAMLPRGMYSPSLLEEISRLEPYGEGIRPPLWWVSGVLEGAGQMGKTKEHYSFTLEGTRGKKWGYSGPMRGSKVDAAVSLDRNSYGGRTTLEYLAEAVRAFEPMELAGMLEGAGGAVVLEGAGEQNRAIATSQSSSHLPIPPAPLPVLDKAARLEQNGTYRASWSERHLTGQTACSPNGPVRPVHRLDPKAAVIQLRLYPDRYAVYAEGEGKEYIRRNFPQIHMLKEEDSHPHILLMALPPDPVLQRWLEGSEVTFSWGDNTLKDLEKPSLWTFEGQKLQPDPLVLKELGLGSALELQPEDVWKSARMRSSAANAFLRFQWAQFYRLLGDDGFERAARGLAGV